jgi:hypothetical protein
MIRSLTGVLLCGVKRGGGVTGVGCGAELRATHPWWGEARVVLDGGQSRRRWWLLALVQEEEERMVRPGGLKCQIGQMAAGPFGPKARGNSFQK